MDIGVIVVLGSKPGVSCVDVLGTAHGVVLEGICLPSVVIWPVTAHEHVVSIGDLGLFWDHGQIGPIVLEVGHV